MACTRLEIEAIENKPEYLKIHSPMVSSDGRKALDSVFYNEITHISWYSLNNVRLRGQSTPGEDPAKSIVTYRVGSNHHYLLYTYLDGSLPALAVKPEYVDTYRIRHCKFIPSRIVEKAVCRIDNSFVIQEMSSEWLTMNPEFFRKVGHDKTFHYGSGHTHELQTFGSVLPYHKLNHMGPWSYSMRSNTAFPIYRLSSQSELVHEYTYNLDLSRILQMEQLIEDKWVKVKPDLTKLNGVPSEDKILCPNLHACVGMIKDAEMKKRSKSTYRLFTETVETCYSDAQVCGSQNKVKVKLEPKGSCKAITWGAKNTIADELNIHGNYTTSIDDLENGLSPIKDTSLVYKSDKFKELGGNHTSGPTLYHHFPRCPSVNGLHGYSFCIDPTDINANVGVLLGEMSAELQVNLQDPDCERWKSGNVDLRGRNAPPKCDFPFMVVVCMLMQREYKIEDGIVTNVFDNIDSNSINTF